MSEKRKDSKGRILRNGETQRADGMYMYRYTDLGGVRRTVYSWRLVATDKTPPKKRACEPLREIEKRLSRDAEDGIQTFTAKQKTLNELFEAYMDMKVELKPWTQICYRRTYKTCVRDSLGSRSISNIKYSDIRNLYVSLFQKRGLKPKTLGVVDAILHPIFMLAVRDNLIRSDPSAGVITELSKKFHWETPKRHALTKEQQEAFIGFVAGSETYRCWLNLFTVFLGTGCRANELLSLRWEDCDFEGGFISINHTLSRGKIDANGVTYPRYISTPKTKAGVRVIPMLKEVREALLDERAKQEETGFNETVIDGYSGFIFTNSHNTIYESSTVNNAIRSIISSYNKIEGERAQEEQRPAKFLPKFSIHNLRHTFCTRFCENETNLKVIQEIMGHANIGTTMDIYNEATMEQKRISFSNLEGKMRLK